MKEKKRFPLLPVLLILVLALLGFGAWFFWHFCFETIVPDEVTREEAVRVAEERLRADAAADDWTEHSTLGAATPLYDPEDRCNGYLFAVETDGAVDGWIQVNDYGGGVSFSHASCGGAQLYVSMTESISVAEPPDGRLYCFSAFAYYEKLADGNFRTLGSGRELSAEDALSAYQEYLMGVRRREAGVYLWDWLEADPEGYDG